MSASAQAWTCPYCPLSCDRFLVDVADDGALTLAGDACALAGRQLARASGAQQQPAQPLVDGRPCDLPTALDAAARLLAASRQPLFAGLGTDVAGARALYPLACATGAICDAAGGAALMQGLRALQDRGQFTTTFAEVRTRADLVVFIGGLPGAAAPLARERLGLQDALARHLVVLGPAAGDAATLAGWAGGGITVESIALQGELPTTIALLAAATAGRMPGAQPPALQALATRLHAAHYAVLVGLPARLGAHGALVIEAVHRIVGVLNRRTRAAALWIGGGNGAATANQVHAWLSGLPLRTRAGPHGLEHEPHVFDTARLLADGAVDALLWVSAFDADALPPACELPLVVLGHPQQAAACARAGSVFIPVATPGVGAAGHLFRTDGTVLMPLHALRSETLPGVAEAARSMLGALERRRSAA
ncbi:MAG: formylmethanofuran dehydrogenase [Burkholderiales bacterium]|nr:formylmethanofuran dehydrogenase [Burkholderiales bacterium]MDE1929400.1 formylmethanofuran dehydrogenase [Burkholderiales bacterium]MDE2157513.1 formylmethanofuran dehydrogenase [Burkholderiales bacterium]MDE2503142.1 formylmethanofuran dehydrogenase [Burkholderiales bacterium]